MNIEKGENMKKKVLLSLTLAIILSLSIAPATVYAAPGGKDPFTYIDVNNNGVNDYYYMVNKSRTIIEDSEGKLHHAQMITVLYWKIGDPVIVYGYESWDRYTKTVVDDFMPPENPSYTYTFPK